MKFDNHNINSKYICIKTEEHNDLFDISKIKS